MPQKPHAAALIGICTYGVWLAGVLDILKRELADAQDLNHAKQIPSYQEIKNPVDTTT